MIEVIVPIPAGEEYSPAWSALRMEEPDGAELTVAPCLEPNYYGWVFADRWERGKTFIICEWDVVPHPGAVEKLANCSNPYCLHRYPLARGNIARGFGFSKYRPVGPAPEHWRDTEWRMLDGQVIPHVHKVLGKPHEHVPAVAHARRTVI